MEISLRLDTLGVVEVRYLRGRERYRDWPQFQLLAASRQAKVISYFPREVAEQLHQQILTVETALGLDESDDVDTDDIDELRKPTHTEDIEHEEGTRSASAERESSTFSPAFAQALKQLNELARQRLPDGNTGSVQSGRDYEELLESESEEDAIEQLQDAFVQMMEVVRELAEELATDALKVSGRFKCARTHIEFVTQAIEEQAESEDERERVMNMLVNESMTDVDEVELVMILQLFEEGRARPDDLPAVELQLDVDDFERLHEMLDIALERDRRNHRRRS
ncbi:MAG TPA: hypothetical protein VL461_03030 [Dictyobacter sp.]|jgi:hypothetical protein|nr:hypothetical protein [Dictyobacter sp.]